MTVILFLSIYIYKSLACFSYIDAKDRTKILIENTTKSNVLSDNQSEVPTLLLLEFLVAFIGYHCDKLENSLSKSYRICA